MPPSSARLACDVFCATCLPETSTPGPDVLREGFRAVDYHIREVALDAFTCGEWNYKTQEFPDSSGLLKKFDYEMARAAAWTSRETKSNLTPDKLNEPIGKGVTKLDLFAGLMDIRPDLMAVVEGGDKSVHEFVEKNLLGKECSFF